MTLTLAGDGTDYGVFRGSLDRSFKVLRLRGSRTRSKLRVNVPRCVRLAWLDLA